MESPYFFAHQGLGYKISPAGIPGTGELFVNHEAAGRGGHLGHAMVEYGDGQILCFYPNCSGEYIDGHNGVGWMEYKRSIDGGQTWSEPYPLPYSKDLYEMNCGKTCMCEKAVRTADGGILLFNLICDMRVNLQFWEPYFATYMKSMDGGRTWTRPQELCESFGRVYDAVTRDQNIYALHCASEDETQEHNSYQLYLSGDCGETFKKRSDLPFKSSRFYGSLEWLPDGKLCAYCYNPEDEFNLEYAVSSDNGKTWSDVRQSYAAKRIRNPQVVFFGNVYFMFGRSGNNGHEMDETGHAVMYRSLDGITWDAGVFLRRRTAWTGSYSNTLVTGRLKPGGNQRLLYQSSFAYEKHRTNILHWWIDAERLP